MFANAVGYTVWSSDGPMARLAFAERERLEAAERTTRR